VETKPLLAGAACAMRVMKINLKTVSSYLIGLSLEVVSANISAGYKF